MGDLVYRLFLGWVKVAAAGPNVESLISHLAAMGFRLWGLSKSEDKYTFYATLSAVPAMLEYGQSHDLTLALLNKGGFPIEWDRSRHRPFLWVGFLTAVVLVIYTLSRVWVIDAITPNLPQAARQQIITVAQDSGLKVGILRKQLDLPKIRAAMAKALPQYSWIGITIEGVVASIQVVVLVPRPHPHIYAKMVANAPGRITKILVYMGDPEVRVGDTVKVGQTLIRGAVSAPMPLPAEGSNAPREETISTPAEGDVWADVGHVRTVFQPFRQPDRKLTGKRFVQQFIWVQDLAPWQYAGYGAIPFAHYVEHRFVHPLRFKGVNLPMKMLKIVYNETTTSFYRLSAKNALAQATTRATDELARSVEKLGPIRHKTRRVRWTAKGVWVTVIWIVNQNIAVPKDPN